jgi:hypothetical protein
MYKQNEKHWKTAYETKNSVQVSWVQNMLKKLYLFEKCPIFTTKPIKEPLKFATLPC